MGAHPLRVIRRRMFMYDCCRVMDPVDGNFCGSFRGPSCGRPVPVSFHQHFNFISLSGCISIHVRDLVLQDAVFPDKGQSWPPLSTISVI